jgi:hypothetical protein
MSAYATFFLNARKDVVQLETVELSHPNWSKVYRLVRNAVQGIQVTLETGASAQYQYYPMQLIEGTTSDDLDQTLQIDLGDLGQVLPPELDNVAGGNGFMTRPLCLYRVYRSDDFSGPIYGPIRYQVISVATKKKNSTLQTQAPQLNINGTGEIYRLDRFTMLRSFQ